jgi:hypothetical protein
MRRIVAVRSSQIAALGGRGTPAAQPFDRNRMFGRLTASQLLRIVAIILACGTTTNMAHQLASGYKL